jgi:membrane-associated protease RseP (regulator of RpoE activity)
MTILKPVPQDRLELIAALRSAVEDVMFVTGYTFDDNGTVHLRGRLKLPADQAYRPLRERVERVGFTPFLKNQEGENVMEGSVELTAMPGVIPKTKSDTRVNLWLFIATVASVIFAGMQFGSRPDGLDVGAGVMYGLTVMAILGAHEMGHYIVGRWRGAPVTLPYFIPLPLIGLFGTMGAMIVQREPFEDRRTLIEVGLAGPLAGFVVAVPLLIIGLILTTTQSSVAAGMGFGDSLLSTFLKTLHFGSYISSAGLHEHPIYIAAWFGLVVTGINLIPAGQLDGGHIAYAILGPTAKYLSYAMIAVFAILSLTVSDTWILWTLLMLAFGRTHPPSLNQAVKLEPIHFALAIIAVLVLVLAFTPNPLYSIGL